MPVFRKLLQLGLLLPLYLIAGGLVGLVIGLDVWFGDVQEARW